MRHSPGEAARYVGLNKSTILRAIKSGKLSATRNGDGTYSIDGSELARVYAAHVEAGAPVIELRHVAPAHAAPPAPAPEPGQAAVELAVALARLEAATARLKVEQEEREREREASAARIEALERHLNREIERTLALAPPAGVTSGAAALLLRLLGARRR